MQLHLQKSRAMATLRSWIKFSGHSSILKGWFLETSMASICSVAFIDPNSAPPREPILPAKLAQVITGLFRVGLWRQKPWQVTKTPHQILPRLASIRHG